MNEHFGFKVKGPIGQVQIWTPSLIAWHGGCNLQPNVNHLGKFKLHPIFNYKNKHLGLFMQQRQNHFSINTSSNGAIRHNVYQPLKH
jgi:hypothetical protein